MQSRLNRMPAGAQMYQIVRGFQIQLQGAR